MAVDRADGTGNIRADPKVYSGADNSSPSGKGTDCGGTANLGTTTQVKSNDGKRTSTYAKDSRPAGVQSFNGGSV